MPTSPRLSKRLYDQLGAETAAGLLEWFDSVDTTYRSELREINEFNFARFDARLEQRVAELRVELGELRATLGQGKAELRQEIANLRAELIKWSFVFFATAALAVIGLR